MHQRRRLIGDRLAQCRVIVAEDVHRDAGDEVEILTPVVVGDPDAVAAAQRDRLALIRVHERGLGALGERASQACVRGHCRLRLGEHGADAALGEQLEQQRVRHARVDDVGRASAVGGPDRRFDLGDHAVADDARWRAARGPSGVELADQRAVAVADTLDVGHQDELAGVQRDGELGGDGVRVHVVRLTVVAETDRRHHRDAPLVEDRHERLRR